MPYRLFTDQMGNILQVPKKVKRIVSLVPSQTELLYHLGLEAEVVGITKFCIYPDEWWRSKTRIGGTKNFNFKAIAALNPDLVIGNKEENYPEGITLLQKKYAVWMSDIYSFEQALQMIIEVGKLTNRTAIAQQLAQNIEADFIKMPKANLSAAYCIWHNPWMAAGGETFIHDLLQRCGFKNVFKNQPRYPIFSLPELVQLNPEVVILSSEPYPFKTKHAIEIQNALPHTQVKFIPGEWFSWYGSKLLDAAPQIANFVQILTNTTKKST